MANRLTISADVADGLLAHARDEVPIEACGLLSGSLARGEADAYHPAKNAAMSRLRYDLDPDDLVRIVLGIERSGRDLVAIFHSHARSPAVPSASDLREAAYPGVFHLLAGPMDGAAAGPTLRAWLIEAGAAVEVPLEVA